MEKINPDISLIIPAYNEEENLVPLIDNLQNYIKRFKMNVEYLIVDDNSVDDTFKVGKQLENRIKNLRIIKNKFPRGMGNGIRYGIKNAKGKIGVTVMADNVDDFSILPEFRRKIIVEGYNLVIGSRYIKPDNIKNVPFTYKFCTKLFVLCCHIFLNIPLKDLTNGYRAYKLDFVRKLPLKRGGYEFSTELTFKTWFNGKKVCEVSSRHGKRLKGISKFTFRKTAPKFFDTFLEALIMRLFNKTKNI